MEYIGLKKITGNVLNSNIKATAWLNVSLAVFASDLPWTSQSGTVNKDKMINGEPLQARGMQGDPGEVYAKGIGTVAPSEVVIDIAGKGYQRFRSYVNLSLYGGGNYAPGAVAFEVYLDGAAIPAFSSDVMDYTNEAILIDLDVTGKSSVRLVTKAMGTDRPEDDLGDWVDAKFLSANIAVTNVSLAKQVYTNNAGQIPNLPANVQAIVPGIGSVGFGVEWPPLTSGMFTSGSVLPIYGKLAGTSNGIVLAWIITDYNQASQQTGFAGKIGSWSEFEKFDFPGIAVDAKPNLSTLTIVPRLIHSQNNLLVENVQKYGFEYGLYPISSGSSNSVVFATPNLTYFEIMNVANSTSLSQNSSFTFEVSPDNATWTAYSATKSGLILGTGTNDAWARRTYTSIDAIPAGTNFLRVTYPSGNTWQFNITNVTLRGGSSSTAYDTDMAYFELGDYVGAINQNEKTVTVTVPGTFDVTNLTPEVYVSPGATYSPAGPQNFTNPVTYTVTNGASSKQYVVTVKKGLDVRFNMYGGNIGGSTDDIVFFVPEGSTVEEPAASPTRAGYIFQGWTTDRASKTPMAVSSVVVTSNITFYAIWEKDPFVTITANADVGLKSWQSEKTSAYGGDSVMLMRQSSNTSTHGQFGELFTNTSTSDSNDLKTAFIRFNVESMKDVNIKSARLVVYYDGVQNGTGQNFLLRATRAASNWNENQVTWVTRPDVFTGDGVVESSTGTPGTARTIEMDVTDIYRNLPDTENKITFAVCSNQSGADYRLTTKEGAGSNLTRLPKLLLEIDPDPDYMVTYDLNGGSGNAPIQPKVNADDEFVIAGWRGLTGPDGKVLYEWNTKADGSGTGYLPGSPVTMPAEDLTLYAIWQGGSIDGCDIINNQIVVVSVRAANPENAVLVLAAYDDEGKLMSAGEHFLAEDGRNEHIIRVNFNIDDTETVRAFLWNTDYTPIIAPKELYKR